jgi:hypothetical protein
MDDTLNEITIYVPAVRGMLHALERVPGLVRTPLLLTPAGGMVWRLTYDNGAHAAEAADLAAAHMAAVAEREGV